MALDLFLTDSGDFSFYTNADNLSDGFVFSFHIAPTDSLLFRFHTVNKFQQKTDNMFNYNFYLYTPKYDKTIKSVSKDGFIYQNIKLRLNTELNTVRENLGMGCDLHTIMHSNIPNNRLCSYIEEMVKASIIDLLPNSKVSVSLLNTNYLDYHDSIKIVIISDEDVYYFII